MVALVTLRCPTFSQQKWSPNRMGPSQPNRSSADTDALRGSNLRNKVTFFLVWCRQRKAQPFQAASEPFSIRLSNHFLAKEKTYAKKRKTTRVLCSPPFPLCRQSKICIPPVYSLSAKKRTLSCLAVALLVESAVCLTQLEWLPDF